MLIHKAIRNCTDHERFAHTKHNAPSLCSKRIRKPHGSVGFHMPPMPIARKCSRRMQHPLGFHVGCTWRKPIFCSMLVCFPRKNLTGFPGRPSAGRRPGNAICIPAIENRKHGSRGSANQKEGNDSFSFLLAWYPMCILCVSYGYMCTFLACHMGIT